MKNIPLKNWEFYSFLKKEFSEYFSEENFEKLIKYKELVEQKASSLKLLSKKDIKLILKKHILESLFFLKILKGKKVIDIGSGAGFPGIPVAIFKKEHKFILIERSKLKAEFLRKVKRELFIKNISIFDDDLEKFMISEYCEYISRAAGYERILKTLKKKELKGVFYPVVPESEERFDFRMFYNPFIGKNIKIAIISI